MLTKCTECGAKISDRAMYCPQCGKQLLPTAPTPTTTSKRTKTKQHMRLPNGFGQISRIKNQKLRKPFRAMVTVGTNENGRPICKLLKPTAYFATYNEAYSALVAYNSSPYDLEKSTTMQELHDLWYPEYSKDKEYSTLTGVNNAWKWCNTIYDIPVKDIRVRHIKECLDKADVGVSTSNRMKQVLNMMLDYALIFDLTDKNYSRMYHPITTSSSSAQRPHITYTQKEMDLLWSMDGKSMYADMLLFQCYSGWRPGEIFALKLDDVDLEEMLITGGGKTEAGRRRIVPIHSKIEHIVRRQYEIASGSDTEYLFPGHYGRMMLYQTYLQNFRKMIVDLNLNPEHRPHDGRIRFVTEAKENEVDEYAIKYLVGHKIRDLTERVYTRRNVLWLKEEIEKIK